jgi:YhzD-like protein
MAIYRITAFEKSGESIVDEQFEAISDLEAKKIGEEKLTAIGALDKTHRCINSTGKLLLFHP